MTPICSSANHSCRSPVLWLTLGLLAASCSKDETRPPVDAADAGHQTSLVDSGMQPDDAGIERPDADSCPPARRFGERCIEEPSSECSVDTDCPEQERCSAHGWCHSAACQSHFDCPETQRCHDGRCLSRVENPAGVQFERTYIPGLDEHFSTAPHIDDTTGGTGFGLTLLDMDGDRDLDVYLGSEGTTPACLYENISRPTQLRFRAVDDYCDPPSNRWHGGVSIDLEGDGYHELIRFGPAMLELQAFKPTLRRQNLLDEFAAEDLRRRCNPGSALPHDFNHDGRVDLMVGCHFDMFHGPVDYFNHLLFLQDEAGQLKYVGAEAWARGESIIHTLRGSTLAIGAADLNDDGLTDLMISEDRIADAMIIEPDPGGVYFACAPNEPCRFHVERFAPSNGSNGAYMGSAVLRLGSHAAHHVYVTDMRDNLLIRLTDSGFRNLARRTNSGLGFLGGVTIFSWGIVVDDFDFDHQDDLYVGNGGVIDQTPAEIATHLDILLLQKQEGEFSWHSGDVGIDPLTIQDSGHEERTYATRAVVKADFDHDGMMDLLATGMEGFVRTHREVPLQGRQNTRCTLIPMPRYVPGHGHGHQLIFDHDPRPRLWDSQGQVRSGISPFILSPHPQGTLVFPSGARTRFDCTQTKRPVLMLEPEWIQITRDSNGLRIELTPEAPAGDLSVLIEGQTVTSATSLGDGVWTLPWPETGERFMLRFGARWTARWWALP